MLQVIHCLQEPFKTSFLQDILREANICRKLASCRFLHESCKMTLICKNNARYLLFARIWQDISNLHKCRKIFLFCKILDIFFKPLQNTYLQKLRKYRLLSRILTYIFWLQESCQKSIVCKNLWGHLFFASISQRI